MRKNILILGHNDVTQFIDIYNQYTHLFDRNLYEVTVAFLTGAPNPEALQRISAEHVLFLNCPKKSLRYLKINAIKTLLALCREKKFAVVICHRYKPIYTMLWVNLFYKIPVLIMVMHELRTMSAWGRQLLAAVLGRKNILFAGVSNAVRDDMRKDLWGIPENRVATLYNMIDIAATEPQLMSRAVARETLHLNESAFVFGNIARLAPNKDQATLIQAFAMIKPACPNAKLMIMGSGALEADLKQQTKQAGLEQEIIFTGFIAQAFRYLKAFDAFVLTSTQEAFGRVLLEAMIAKQPIIATRVHGIPEVMANTGVLINSKDPQALADAMQKIYHLSQTERQALGETAYQHAEAHFSIPVFQQQFWQLPLLQSLKS